MSSTLELFALTKERVVSIIIKALRGAPEVMVFCRFRGTFWAPSSVNWSHAAILILLFVVLICKIYTQHHCSFNKTKPWCKHRDRVIR